LYIPPACFRLQRWCARCDSRECIWHQLCARLVTLQRIFEQQQKQYRRKVLLGSVERVYMRFLPNDQSANTCLNLCKQFTRTHPLQSISSFNFCCSAASVSLPTCFRGLGPSHWNRRRRISSSIRIALLSLCLFSPAASTMRLHATEQEE
jgi:hypothetical protein